MRDFTFEKVYMLTENYTVGCEILGIFTSLTLVRKAIGDRVDYLNTDYEDEMDSYGVEFDKEDLKAKAKMFKESLEGDIPDSLAETEVLNVTVKFDGWSYVVSEIPLNPFLNPPK